MKDNVYVNIFMVIQYFDHMLSKHIFLVGEFEILRKYIREKIQNFVLAL